MYEQNYRVGGDLYRLRQEALRREKGAFPDVAYAPERDNTLRDVFRSRPDELRVCWDGGYKSGFEPGAPPCPVEPIREQIPDPVKEPEHKESILDKLHLKTEDIILLGLVIFLIYCKAEWDIIIILGVLFFIGWSPEGLHNIF